MATRSSTICLNSKHHVTDTVNTFEYKFPSPQSFLPTDTIALQEISIYNSFFNITESAKNNRFSIIWNANTAVQYDFIIPDSFLDVDGINAYLIQQMTLNKLYMINTATGDYVYYIAVVTNASQYACQFYISALPTSTLATSGGLTIPAGATWTFPTATAKTPQIIFNDAFGLLLGFAGSTLPLVVQSTLYTILSTKTPQIVSITNVMIGCNIIKNNYSNPSNILSAIPINGSIGSLLYFSNANATYNNIHPQQYDSVIVQFYDQFNQPLIMHDFNINVLLNIKRYI